MSQVVESVKSGGWARVILTIITVILSAYGSVTFAIGEYKGKVDSLTDTVSYHLKTEEFYQWSIINSDHDKITSLVENRASIEKQLNALEKLNDELRAQLKILKTINEQRH